MIESILGRNRTLADSFKMDRLRPVSTHLCFRSTVPLNFISEVTNYEFVKYHRGSYPPICMNVSFISSIKANPPSGKLSISNMKRKFLGREMCTEERRLDYKVTFLTIKESCSEAGPQYIFLRKKAFCLNLHIGKHHITYSQVYNKIVTILSVANTK